MVNNHNHTPEATESKSIGARIVDAIGRIGTRDSATEAQVRTYGRRRTAILGTIAAGAAFVSVTTALDSMEDRRLEQIEVCVEGKTDKTDQDIELARSPEDERIIISKGHSEAAERAVKACQVEI